MPRQIYRGGARKSDRLKKLDSSETNRMSTGGPSTNTQQIIVPSIQEFLLQYGQQIPTAEIPDEQPFESSNFHKMYGFVKDDVYGDGSTEITDIEQMTGLRSIPSDTPSLSARYIDPSTGQLRPDNQLQGLRHSGIQCNEVIIHDRHPDGRPKAMLLPPGVSPTNQCPREALGQVTPGDQADYHHEHSMCVDLTHSYHSGHKHALCLPCSEYSRRLILIGCGTPDDYSYTAPPWLLTPNRIQMSRAYLCAPCTKLHISKRSSHQSELIGIPFPVTPPSSSLYPPGTASGSEIANSTHRNDLFRCRCSKLLDAELCLGHRLLRAEEFNELTRAIDRLILKKFRNKWAEYKPCPVCQERPGVDAYGFKGEDGGEGLKVVEWLCVVCQVYGHVAR